MLDGRPIGHAVKQAGNIADIADRLQIPLLLQLFDQRNDVNRPGRFGQVHHARINAPVRINGKILGLQMLGGIIEGVIIQQHSAEDRALRFNVRR